jgi:hypothetical protein
MKISKNKNNNEFKTKIHKNEIPRNYTKLQTATHLTINFVIWPSLTSSSQSGSSTSSSGYH